MGLVEKMTSRHGDAKEEFNTNVPNKEDRKKARRGRIEKRHAPEDRNIEDASVNTQGASKTGGQQVSDSLLHLDRRKHTGLQEMTQLRVKTDTNEAKRRTTDEEIRKDRLTKLQQEAFASAKANAAIDMKWSELLTKDIPQELHRDISFQNESCAAVIRSKDELIAEFQRQLRAKDEEYVRALRQQSEDVTDFLQRIRSEFKELQTEYDREIELIDDAYTEERERIISEHVGEIDSMFEHRRNKEMQYKETKQKREEQYQKDIEDLINKGADQYSKLKTELELNIQTLKQQLEEIRSTYQLNTEKLDYNYRVLTELDVEKNAELARYKRKLTKLKDTLSVLVTKHTEMSASDQKTNAELTSDYRSLTRKYKELQAKFRHFEVSDTQKYDEVWLMHEEEAKDLIDKLLKADKLITENFLGWNWLAPDMAALQQVLGKQGNLGNPTGSAPGSAGADMGEGGGMAGEEKGGDVVAGEEVEKEQAVVKSKTKKMVPGARIRGMMKLLASEATFLINADVQASLEAMPDDEAEIGRAEAMLKVLGVKSEESLQKLTNYFFRENQYLSMIQNGDVDAAEEMEAELRLHNAPEDVSELRNMINAEDVIYAIRNYMEDMTIEGAPRSAPRAAQGGKATEEDIRIGQKRLQSMRGFWVNLAQIVSDEAIEVWQQLERDCKGMHELLNKRAANIAEVDNLTQRNAELKRLLNQYLGDSRTNSSLQVPPAQVMRVRPSATAAIKGKTGGGGGPGEKKILLSKTH